MYESKLGLLGFHIHNSRGKASYNRTDICIERQVQKVPRKRVSV